MADLVEFGSAADAVQNVGDLLGVFAFAISGALLAVHKRFDLIGIVVLAVCTALGGGILRDVIIGETPPVAFDQWRYPLTATLAALLIFFWHPPRRFVRGPLDMADAVGLGIFCVTGTLSAYQHGFPAHSAAALGVVTAAGGGVIRDLLGGRTPSLLRPDEEVYAIPALIGAATTAALLHFDLYTYWAGALAGAGAFGVRVLALRLHWRAPMARPHRRRRGDDSPEVADPAGES
ncbi:trimeric intracellular cation channel family protein [Nocardia uniformis]|uniref:Trimeric intracellular cation channel family protein n=1 Tax=Nocardia uniformis TaxID=53432 RepID=A0A849C2R3_9NOCA|nr:trimeric intracellular cation channel family protein [Nocardia uniformis]NNH70117.1 trimeric intracellular cation channel family protein [Nocardia uniformis]